MQDSMDPVNLPRSQRGNKYEVFLSYSRDEGPQESFSSCLCSSLREAGISVLEDDISNEVLQSIIEGCKISIIIFSEHYATSRSCLVELAKLMEFHRAYDHFVLPIFHGVDGYEVRNQESSFGEAFQDLIQRISPTDDEVSSWRTALTEAGGKYGFFVPNFQSNNESEVAQNIVEHVLRILDTRVPFVTDDGLVGVSSKVQEVMTMLQKHKSEDVVSIGIWGMGGVGKTTLARAIFAHILPSFDITCFLEDVRETWRRNGQVDLTKRLLLQICEATGMRTDDSIGSVRLELKRRHCHKKVLLVVDDVDDLEQLEALCGSREWFGKGSRIIITTRDRQLLHAFQVDYVYEIHPLAPHESLELFSRTAFQQECPEEEFFELSTRVVEYAKGLPLALKTIGSFLCGRSSREWKSILEKLSTTPLNDIENALKLSFDSLEGDEKDIFLHIVLFYIGEDMDDVIQELDAHGCNASTAIRVLEDRGLVTIDENNKLRMHDLLKDMGRQIIRETSQNELRNQEHSGHMYEVFLSFRGEDVRTTFNSHLYSALCNAGINVFKDDVNLPRGKFIKTELLRAIGSSKIAIIIFSRDYAGSTWWLEELAMIMGLHRSNRQVALPVFYNVDPYEIRNQTSSFGTAFNKLIQRISPSEAQVFNWRTALAEAGGISGIVVLGSRDESENVKAVVKSVCDILDKKDLFVADHPVGVDNRVKEVITMLQNHQSEDVIMVGIWGMGGLGKSTIAKAIYNEIGRTFESRCYLSSIREVWGEKKDQVSLQDRLLSEICKTTTMKIHSIESGKNTLMDRLRHIKALVVLDDVDDSDQLKALAGSRDWFKPGSRIIITTTRNQRPLHEMGCSIYPMKNLDEGESIKLFSWHAFKQESPKEDFTELSRDIAAYYCGRLPLALEVLGSYLFGRELEEWNSVLEKLKNLPNNKIQEKLKISFEGLDELEKEIFLDISCFFIGMDRNDVTQILNGCGLFAIPGIKTLVERSLVTIDEKNMLGMHDLLRNMGREIIREESKKELGKRSRLWFHEDARSILLEHKGTEAIEGLSLKLRDSEKMHFQAKAFKMMKKLRLLSLDNVQLRGDYKYMSKDLKWLCWHGFPVKFIPSTFYQKKLVAIDLECSSLRKVWKEPLESEELKILNLSHSHYLVQTPDFSKLPNLEKLILKDCPRLSLIHHSIGLLFKLLLLDLEDCVGLRSLPRSIYRLKCLKTLVLSGCVMIEELEEDIEQMESLTTLIAPTIKQAPFSLVKLKSILYLSVCGYEGLSHNVIPSLFRSWMSPSNNPLALVPSHAGMPSPFLWKMLKRFCGRRPTVPSRDEPKQQSLLLKEGLEIPDCLSAINDMDISRLENRLKHCLIQIVENCQVFHTLSKGLENLTNYGDGCVLPSDNYPYWLTFKSEGASVNFKVPPINGYDNLKGITISCVCIPSSDLGNMACEPCIRSLMITNYTKMTSTLVSKEDKANSLEETESKEIISNIGSDDQVEVRVVFGNGLTVKKMVVYLIYKDSFDEQMEPSTSKATNLTVTKRKCEGEEEEDGEIKFGNFLPIVAAAFFMVCVFLARRHV